MSSEGNVKRVAPSKTKASCYDIEIELSEAKQGTPSELHFTLCSELLGAFPQKVAQYFLRNMTFKQFAKGEPFIQQGDEGTHFYIILKGSCIVRLKKNDMMHRVAVLGTGDIVGEMAVFIGERHSAYVDAETDIDVLSMKREQFDVLSREYPEFKNFLSEVITKRLGTSKVIADRTIGKYIVTEIINQGAAGIIFKGSHRILHMPVAIKMLKHDLAMHPDFIELFRKEAKTIAQLNHPHIIRVYDIEELYKTVFIIMEYLEGTTLKDMLKNTNGLPFSKVLDIIIQACFGLEYAHNHSIIHQDINPQNLFVQSDGHVKIIDFGLACPPGCIDLNFLFPGTIFYISPEQINGDPIDERTDIYSLGITAYEMITGETPFTGETVRTLINAHLYKDIPDIRARFPDIPDALRAFLTKATQKEPSARYQNVSEILKELTPLAETCSIDVTPRACKLSKMIGIFVQYQDEQQLAVKRLIEEFNKNISETGAKLRVTPFEDL
jgi:serine/threonine protein kinase